MIRRRELLTGGAAWTVSALAGRARGQVVDNPLGRLGVGGAATTRGAEFVDPSPDDKLLPININQVWGLMNQHGQIIALPQFDWTDVGYQGLARATRDGQTGFILGNGEWAIEPSLEYADRVAEGAIVFGRAGRLGYMDRTGEVRFEPRLDGALRFREGMAAVRVDQRCAYLDQSYDVSIPARYDVARSFHGGLAAVRGARRGVWGFINKAGQSRFVDEGGRIDALGDFEDGRALVKVAGRWGYLSKAFRPVIEPRYRAARDFADGFAAVRVDGKWGYIDKTGAMAIAPQFDGADDFDDTLARVRLAGRYGFINKTGAITIPATYERALPFARGLAQVSIEESFGYVDVSGRLVWDPRWAQAGIINQTLRSAVRRKVSEFRNFTAVIRTPQPRPPREEPYPPEYLYDEGLGVLIPPAPPRL